MSSIKVIGPKNVISILSRSRKILGIQSKYTIIYDEYSMSQCMWVLRQFGLDLGIELVK